MGTCHPMATLKFIDSVTLFSVNIKLRYKYVGVLLYIDHTISTNIFSFLVLFNHNLHIRLVRDKDCPMLINN